MKTFPLFCIALLNCLDAQLPAAPAGDPLDQWHQLNPAADLFDVVDADFANGRWVAVRGDGVAVTSLDGTHWTRIESFEAAGIVEFGGSHWVASTTANIMVTSNNGLVWTPAAWGPADHRLVGLSFGNGRWLAHGAHRDTGKETLFWSTDEVTWNKVKKPPEGSLLSLAFGSGEWLALTWDEFFVPVLSASADGEAWTTRELPKDIGYFASLSYGNGMWVISYEGTLWKSLDGVKWEKIEMPPETGTWTWSGIGAWIAGRWINQSFWSTNLIDWNSVPTRAIAYGQSKWMGVDDGNRLLSSTDKRRWTVEKRFTAGEFPFDLDFADNLWVLGGTAQDTNLFILTSPNGQAWTPAAIPAGESGFMRSLRHTSQGWVALVQALGTRLLRSSDGRNWTWETLGSLPNNDLLDLTYGNGQWLGLSIGSFVSSTNLSDWQVLGPSLPLVGGFAIWGVEFRKLEFVHGLWLDIKSLSNGGPGPSFISTSTDGVKWTERYSGQYDGQGIRDITFADGRLMAVDRIGSVLESDPLLSLELKRPGEVVVRRASGIPAVIESSEDLRQWHTLTKLPVGGAIQNFTDPEAASSSTRFYRTRTP